MNAQVREYADGILTAIEQPLLTDDEAQTLPDVMDTVQIYRALASVINARSFPGDGIDKLNAYAVLHGVDYTGKREFSNNIFIGAVLE